MPLILSPLKMIGLQSTAVSPGGMPSSAMPPPWFITSIISRSAAGLPDISRPTSKPSVMPSSLITSRNAVDATLTARVAPTLAARPSRYSLTSVTTTWRAPTCRAMAAAIRPIGPAPATSTSSPTRS